MEIQKYQNDYGTYDIELIANNKKLSIYQGGSDPNIACRYLSYEDMKNGLSHIFFDIPASEIELYEIFTKLHRSIVEVDILGCGKPYETYKNTSIYEEIVKEGVVEIISDSYPRGCPNTLRIESLEDKIHLEFDQADGKAYGCPKSPYGISINIRQSGCGFDPFIIPFNTMYKEAQSLKDYSKELILK